LIFNVQAPTGTTTLRATFTYDPAEAPAVIPVPASLPLLAAGLGALAFVRRKRHAV
jgi:hypothetical protein